MAASDPYQPRPYSRIRHPEWARDATIYQINTRQFTAEGTFQAAAAHLSRLADLGATVLWLMPVHPIGAVNRKGTLGSPYAVNDYYSVNPEFGTMEDLKHFVSGAHQQGLRVILDRVANHTAWDCILATEHPEWYVRDHKGDFQPTPWWDWDDIIDLDYSQPGLRRWMTEAMAFWVREVDVDGFRCDVAGYVPIDFWENARRELEAIKPVFMLAEWESRDMHAAAFDMTYAWSWNDVMHRIAHGGLDLTSLHTYYSWNQKFWPHDALRMTFVSNHDKNAWEGTEFERFGPALEVAIVLSVVGEGFPLIYNGQEAGHDKRLEFFERDPIRWREHPLGDLYRRLFALKRNTSALWNGLWGARMEPTRTSAHDHVLAFVRATDRDRVFAVLNLSDSARSLTVEGDLHHGDWTDWVSGERVRLDESSQIDVTRWGYRLFVAIG
jgi:glycosidase